MLFRLLVLTLIATLTVAPGTSVLCRSWCDTRQPVSASECHHPMSGADTAVSASASCDDALWQAAVYLRADAPRLLDVAAVADAAVPAVDLDASLGVSPACGMVAAPTPFCRSPLNTVLRI